MGISYKESKVSERDTLKAVLALLRMRRILHFRMNSGSLRDHTGRPVRFGTPGMADVLAFRNDPCRVEGARPIWIECKAPKGKQSAYQKSFQALVEAEGHRYVVARSLDDVLRIIE